MTKENQNQTQISYKELLKLPNDKCVKVNRVYFHFLKVKAELLEIKDEKYWNIIYKYLKIDEMINDLKKHTPHITHYYLMSVLDIKYLISIIKDVPKSKITFKKSNITLSQLNQQHENIKKLHQETFGKVPTIDYDEKNIDNLTDPTNKSQDDGTRYIMTESSHHCEVKITEESRKKLVKALLK